MTSQKDPITPEVTAEERQTDATSLFRNMNGTWTLPAIALAAFGLIIVGYMMY
jgi:hypothetical protein